MSFCRITGKARGLPKPNYFPLLPPISPADAKRFCRITGKAYGLPGHHYTPVLLVRQSRKEKDKVTGGAAGNEHHHYPVPPEAAEPQRHVVLADFRYVFPSLEESVELGEFLSTMKENALVAEEKRFVYTVAERRCSLVIPARLEAAVRDGEVRGVLLAEDTDEVRFQFRKGKDLTVGVKEMGTPQSEELYDGEGPSEAAQAEAAKPKKKKRKKEGLSCMTKIFEEKERVQEVEAQKVEEIKAKRAKVVEVKLSAPETPAPVQEETQPQPELVEWHEFDAHHHRVDVNLVMCSGDWRDLVKPLIESWDWDEFEREAAAVAAGAAVVTELPKPVPHRAELLDLSKATPGVVPQPAAAPGTGALPPASSAAPLAPLLTGPDAAVQTALESVSEKDMERTSGVTDALKKEKNLKLLPEIKDIPSVVAELEKGTPSKIGPKAHGLVLDIGAAKKFIAGQTVNTPTGPVFVPGQTLDTPAGPSFVPGMTVLTQEGPMLIPGQKVNTPAAGSIFVAGQTLATREGMQFVPGQTMDTPDGPRFMPGQTVMTDEGPKFIAGQIVSLPEGGAKFVPGQTITSPDGPKFIPGQTMPTPDGTHIFLPGQSVRNEAGAWEFVPGQTQRSTAGDVRFVAGQTILTEDGPKFVAGRSVPTEKGMQFVPGVTVEESDGSLRFVPGRTVQTAEGPRFVEGQVVCTGSGAMFVPGRTSAPEDGIGPVKFAVAKSLDEAMLAETATAAAAVAQAVEEESASDAVFGHMVQTAAGVEFFPGARTSGLPAGKLVPGRLHRSGGDVRFVPGIEVTEEPGMRKFVPGQVVETERGEQFVPGQVVDTADGPKFVPGQVVETRTGPKFVPGQTVDTPEGPRFVPGQIVDTKAGPTFIPGQVISTAEEGSRFVPGQVVDTVDGPRFVPGRVVETGDRVTFIPGQVVETKEGLRFVAPDLTDGCEFSVQGFEVTPEELKLLRPAVSSSLGPADVAAVDSKMLRQLSAAGVAVGRHVPADLPGVAVASDAVLASDVVRGLAERLQLHGTDTVKLADVLGTVVRLGTELLEQARSPNDLRKLKMAAVNAPLGAEESVKEFVRSLVSAVALTASQEHPDNMLQCAGSVLGELLLGVESPAAVTLVESLHAFLTVPGSVREIRNDACEILHAECKLELLRTLVTEQIGEAVPAERITAVLGDRGREEVLGEAFVRLSAGHPELVEKVLGKVSQNAGVMATEKEASEAVQAAIVSAVRESSERQLRCLLAEEVKNEVPEELRCLVEQAMGLARALGLFDAADTLLEVLEDPAATRALADDPIAMDVLGRLTVMRALCERRPAHADALRRLQSDPFDARDDPCLRELVRDSAVLLVPPSAAMPLTSAADVPAALLLADNCLAVEDFLARASPRAGPLLILKPGLQTVIPREASRAVLTGQVAYTVLDNKGIRYFEPLHVLSALRLPRIATHRFTMYRCAMADPSSAVSLASSSEDLTSRRGSWAPDSLFGSSVSTRRRSSDARAPLLQPPHHHRGSLDTGTGTITGSPDSEGSGGGGQEGDAFTPRLPPGYLDAETRLRIATALAGGRLAPRVPRPPLSLGSSRSGSVARSASTTSLKEPSPQPAPRHVSRLHRPKETLLNGNTESREESPVPRKYVPPSTTLARKNSLSELTPNQRRILEELRRNSYVARHKELWTDSRECSPVICKSSREIKEPSPPPKSSDFYSSSRQNDASSPSRDGSPICYTRYTRDLSPIRHVPYSYSLRNRNLNADTSPDRLRQSRFTRNISPPAIRVLHPHHNKELPNDGLDDSLTNTDGHQPIHSSRYTTSVLDSRDESPSSLRKSRLTRDSSPPVRSFHNSYLSKDLSPSGHSSKDSSPVRFVPRKTQIRLPNLSPPPTFASSFPTREISPVRRLPVSSVGKLPHLYRRADTSPLGLTSKSPMRHHNYSLYRDVSPIRHRTYREISPITHRIHRDESPVRHRTYRFEPLGSDTYRSKVASSTETTGHGAYRLDSSSPTEPLSLGSFRTVSVSPTEVPSESGRSEVELPVDDPVTPSYRPPALSHAYAAASRI